MLIGVLLVISSVGATSCSQVLDARVRVSQAREGEAKSLGVEGQEFSSIAARAKKAEDLQRLDFLQRLEWALFDLRVRLAATEDQSPTQVGLVFAGDSSVESLATGEAFPQTAEMYDLFWPRWPVYGRVLRELRAQGAKAVAFDVLFFERRFSEDRLVVAEMQDGVLSTNKIPSDARFGAELAKPGSPAVLAVLPGIMPSPLFHGGASAIGDAFSPRDADSVARRVRLVSTMRWVNPEIGIYAYRQGVGCTVSPEGQVSFPSGATNVVLKPDSDGRISLPTNRRFSRKVPVFIEKPVWHLGIALAAEALGLDLDHPERVPGGVRVRSTNGVERILPVDAAGYMIVDWRLSVARTNLLLQGDISQLLAADQMREFRGEGGVPTWTNRVVVFGSSASGNNLADRGATPLDKADLLVTTHMNVADMVLRNQFVRRLASGWDLMIVAVMGCCAAMMTWRLRGLVLPVSIVLMAAVWMVLCVWMYQKHRFWLPLAHPVFAGLLIPYLGMVTTRAFVEQREQLRVRQFFEKMVSPDIVEEVLKARELARVGAGNRRRLTVFFADVRGFTEMTDRYQVAAEKYVTEHGLDEAAAELYYEQQASEVLSTVNLYLATIADVVKFHRGTLDKYIGDCVMAFWGAPLANQRHAVDGVMAALDAQWAVQYLNEARAAETDRREVENPGRIARGEIPLPPVPVLNLGSGLNTGEVIVGFMGSDDHIRNYTVFGREVNLASRLEGASGHARILVGEATYLDLLRNAPDLAALCKALSPVAVKGFRQPVLVYEVPWQGAREAAAKYGQLLSEPIKV
jgi:adenylate cyclase